MRFVLGLTLERDRGEWSTVCERQFDANQGGLRAAMSATVQTAKNSPEHTTSGLPRITDNGAAERNPLVWMAEINGLLVDLRDMPRDVQEIAFAKGMIPLHPGGSKGSIVNETVAKCAI
jgi:hypothetical protein